MKNPIERTSLGLSLLITLFIITASVSPVHASEEASELNYQTIQKMNSTCLALARKERYDVAIAIYDQGGVLVSFTQSDGAAPATGEVARWKGLSASYYRTATAETGKWNVPNAPKIATIRGGYLFFRASVSP